MKMEENIEYKVTEIIKGDEISNIPADIAELTLDSFLDEGIAKDIPIIGWGISIAKLGFNVRTVLFQKKMLTMLNEIKNIPRSKREKVINDIETNEKYETRVGETLIILIDKMDDLNHPKFVGKLFRSLIKDSIDYNMFLRLATIVTRTFSLDIYSLRDFANGKQIDQIQLENLSNQGLLTPIISEHETDILDHITETEAKKEIKYKMNILSKKLIENVFNR